jgi:hypothetical protein
VPEKPSHHEPSGATMARTQNGTVRISMQEKYNPGNESARIACTQAMRHSSIDLRANTSTSQPFIQFISFG